MNEEIYKKKIFKKIELTYIKNAKKEENDIHISFRLLLSKKIKQKLSQLFRFSSDAGHKRCSSRNFFFLGEYYIIFYYIIHFLF